jgi:hypothetical protein
MPPRKLGYRFYSMAGLQGAGRPYIKAGLDQFNWGMVEDKLSTSFAQIWLDIFSQTADSLDTILSTHLDMLARRLDIMLGSG